jgi:hypothetical protein
MQHVWFSFSDNPWSGLAQLGWPEFDLNREILIELGKDSKPQVDFAKPSIYDAPCSTVKMGALSTSL